MKNLLLIGVFCILTATQTGCVCLRYTYEPAVNTAAKQGTIKRITNDYVEYQTYSTNDVTTKVVKTTTYRAYYATDGSIYKTTEVK